MKLRANLVLGHTQNEDDLRHALIQKEVSIYRPDQLVLIVRQNLCAFMYVLLKEVKLLRKPETRGDSYLHNIVIVSNRIKKLLKI